MELQEGWFSDNEPIPDKMIDSYLNDYLVYCYLRIYNMFEDNQKQNYKKLINSLNTLKTFKDLDKKMNAFIEQEAKNQPKENAIQTAARIAKGFGIPNNVINNSIEDFKQNELNDIVYEEASIEKNPYMGDTLSDYDKASMWRPDTNEEDNEDWMMLWKEKNKQESSEKLSESIKHNENESISNYLIRMKNLFTE